MWLNSEFPIPFRLLFNRIFNDVIIQKYMSIYILLKTAECIIADNTIANSCGLDLFKKKKIVFSIY